MIPILLFTMRKVLKLKTIFALLLVTILFLLLLSANMKGLIGSGGLTNLDTQKQIASIIFTIICFIWTVGIPVSIMVTTIGSGLIANEESEGTMLLLVSKPLRRFEIVLGKFLGLFLSTYIYLIAVIFFSLIIFYKATGTDPETLDTIFGVLPGIFIYSALVVMFFASLSIFLSSLFKKRIPAVVILIFIVFFTYFLSPMLLKSLVEKFFFIDLNYQFSNILYHLFTNSGGIKVAPSIQTYLGFVVNVFKRDPYAFDPDIQAMPPSLTLNDAMSPAASIIYLVSLSIIFIVYSVMRLSKKDAV